MHTTSGMFVTSLKCIFFVDAAISLLSSVDPQLGEEQLVLFWLHRGVELHQVCSTHDFRSAHQSLTRMSLTSFMVLCHILGHSLTTLLSICYRGSVAAGVFQPSASVSGT